MKFRYYITDTCSGTVSGTDDSGLAHDLSLDDDLFIIDTELGKFVNQDGDDVDIREFDS